MDGLLVHALGLLLSLVVGLAAGLEREKHAEKERLSAIAGVRSFTLFSILGYFLPILVDELLLASVLAVSVIVFIAVPILRARMGKFGMTTGVALLVVMLIGVLSGFGFLLEAGLLGIMVVVILVCKQRVRAFAGVLTVKEMESITQFVAIAAVLLPITYGLDVLHPLVGPGRLIDPFKIVLMVIFVSSISFTSYMTMKLIGTGKGAEISAFLGGFVNSAASTASMAQHARRKDELLTPSIRGTILTNLSMVFKDVIILAVLGGLVLGRLMIFPALAMTFVSLISLKITSRETISDFDLRLDNPFAVVPALKFGLLFMLISAFTYMGSQSFGDAGVYATAIAGLISTTTVSASVGVLYATGTIGASTGSSTVLFALSLGCISKLLITSFYRRELSRKLILPMVILALVAFVFGSIL